MNCLDWERDIYMPAFHTYAGCLEEVSKCGRALQDVPESLIDTHLCNVAIAESGYAIAYVPVKRLMTLEMCVAAVRNHAGARHHVPEKFKLRCAALTR